MKNSNLIKSSSNNSVTTSNSDIKDTFEKQQQITNVNYRQIKKSKKNPNRSTSSRYYKTIPGKKDPKPKNSLESSNTLTKTELKKNKKLSKSDFLHESNYEFLNSSLPDLFSTTKTKSNSLSCIHTYFLKLKFALF